MTSGRVLAPVGLALVLGVAVCAPARSGSGEEARGWRELVMKRLPLLGHRNWIVIADSAYPAQSQPGIEMVLTGADQIEVVRTVLDLLAKTKHVKPVVFLDSELPHIDDPDAPGIDRYRARLKKELRGQEVRSLPHAKLLGRVDAVGQRFQVLVLKTNLTLPYTSVFLELGCGYWSDEAEARLRKAIKKAGKKKP
jgi:L-fucose mutarotase/ribose pyranase (RbsD/FucU family)